jgi:cardiolipin synthase
VTIGSYNVNDLSTFASIELNIDVLDNRFAAIAEKELQRIIDNDCVLVTSERFEAHNTFLKRVWQKACYVFIRVMFVLFTFYFKQNK